MVEVENYDFVVPVVFIVSGKDCQWLFKNGLIHMTSQLLLITKGRNTFVIEQLGGPYPEELIKFSVTNSGTM